VDRRVGLPYDSGAYLGRPTVTTPTTQQALDLAREHLAAGRLAEAEALYAQVLSENPDHPRALSMLGVLMHQTGRDEQGIDLLRRAVAARPGEADFHCNLGVVLADLGRADEAVVAYRAAISHNPRFAAAYSNLGNVLAAKGDIEGAIDALRRAAELQPDLAEAAVNLGLVLHGAGRAGDAAEAFRRAAKMRPQLADHYRDLGNTSSGNDQVRAAADAFRVAALLRPDWAEAHRGIGAAMLRLNQPDEAMAAFRRAIALNPSDGESYFNLAKAVGMAGDLDLAITLLEKSAALRPELGGDSYRLMLMLLHPGYSPDLVLREHRKWATEWADPLTPANPEHPNDRAPDRRLRVGYVSQDFCDHPVGLNMIPLLREHDKTAVEVFCYSSLAKPPDVFTENFRRYANHWRDVINIGDEQLAEMIRADRIDVLVDLSLHTPGHRLLAFARKPAPVQATFAGYPGTTGLAAIDYRLTDPYLDPPGSNDQWYTEQSVRLSDTFWCYEPGPTPPVGPLPAQSNGFITFGCLNNFAKVNQPILRLWAAVLRAVDGSRLLLLASPGGHRQRVREIMAADGVAPERVLFHERVPTQQYLTLYNAIDISLDPFPYNGHVSSLDSLWMGVPVVTLVGQAAWSRAGWSQLSNLYLTQLAAFSPEQFVQIAAALAGNVHALAELRAALRDRVRHSPLQDARRFARGIEQAYRAMWRRWCAGASRTAPD